MEVLNDNVLTADVSNDFFKSEDGVSLKSAWEVYKKYCEDAKIFNWREYNEDSLKKTEEK